ncbi:hypothetical protein [Pseudomonas chlororaphis]|uniref:hypothetical protein n=1 Tax=Pseudomonas chlororaphis TaxID=587753 RepID=UPI0015DF50D2|nr:hypothetical protein [Pseudomonas chlororaphis]QLL10696.1 hypothetical protein H0I86_16635 [Pseudomonas chlororaphis subsp. aurantiaca]
MKGTDVNESGSDFDDFTQCRLEFKLDVNPRYGEPSDYVLHYEGSVLSGEGFDQPVGTISIYVADLQQAYFEGQDPWEVLDSVDNGLAHFCSLISRKTGRFKRSVEYIVGSDIERLLIISHLFIDPEYRGSGLGLSAIDVACKGLGNGAAAALKAFPTQWEGCVVEDPKAFRRDRLKLMRYYQRVAFFPVLGDGLMARALF